MSQTQDTTTTTDFPVTAAEGVSAAVLDTVRQSNQYKNWLASMDRKRYVIKSVHVQSVDMFGPKLGFVKFSADIVNEAGKKVNGIIFMRGGSVGILPILRCGGKLYTVLTVQHRPATGFYEYAEMPAGMLDGSGNFAGVAAKELDEELHLKINEKDLVDLSALAGHTNGYWPSPGACDETIRHFYFTKDVSAEELAEMNGKATGALGENEQITLKIVELDSLPRIPDAKTCLAYYQYRELVEPKLAGTTGT